jgi:hypothetical protein
VAGRERAVARATPLGLALTDVAGTTALDRARTAPCFSIPLAPSFYPTPVRRAAQCDNNRCREGLVNVVTLVQRFVEPAPKANPVLGRQDRVTE